MDVPPCVLARDPLALARGQSDLPVDRQRKLEGNSRTPELEESYAARTGDPYERLPLIVLINNASASASEIVSGAIQDWDRGLVVGRRSFGKGLVQEPFELADGSAMRLTVSRYYTPSGRCIQKDYKKAEKLLNTAKSMHNNAFFD